MRRISLSFLPLLVLAAGIVVGARAATASTTLSLVAYSTPKDAYGKIIPAFQATTAGKNVSFNQSYGASGDQARAVAAGLSADIVALPRAGRLDAGQKGIVPSNWNQNRYHGMVTDSVVVFVVRDGNPKKIHTWADLAKSGVQVSHSQPVHLGRRPLECDGCLWRAARARQDRQPGDRLPQEAVQERLGAAEERPRGRPRCSRAARATCC